MNRLLATALLLGAALAALAPYAHAQAPVPTTLSYQGVLTDGAGNPVPDGTYTVALRLFTAAAGGAATYAENHTVSTVGGVFSAELGAGTPTTGTWAGTAFDKGYWLETAVGGTTLGPRTKLLAGPYARALALPYTASVGSAGSLLYLTNTTGSGLRGESAAATGAGIWGQATSATGVSYGGFFRSASTSGQAVFAQATAASGTTYGVYGTASSPQGRGVAGVGGTYGGHFTADGSTGAGVYGEGTATTGTNYGGFFRAASTGGQAVFAQATATTGTTYGVRGTASSPDGYGVHGEATGASGGTGVFGRSTATSGAAYGVHGISTSTGGSGVYGAAAAGSGTTSGVSGISTSPSGRGVSGTSPNYGVYGQGSGSSGRGVYGLATSTSGTTYGGYFQSASAAGYGLYATNTASGGLAARFAGQTRFDNDLNLYEGNGTDVRIILDVDEGNDAPALKLRRNNVTVIELDAEHNGNARVITEELEITGGSDLAEHFDVAPLDGLGALLPGMVVSIDPAQAGRLAVSTAPYDPLVAGVVSGAGGVRTGFLMGQRGSIADGDTPIALVGRVYVLVDATYGEVRPGDLLTTSATPGHAMRAADRERAAGAVLGKAMTGLEAGRGLVLVLVGLQ